LRVFEVEPNQQVCGGDCDADGTIGINELVQAVRIALDLQILEACRAIDSDSDGRVTIAELIAAVRGALVGCEPPVR
jgi:Ca2+-binding EF-hand superfamily protein